MFSIRNHWSIPLGILLLAQTVLGQAEFVPDKMEGSIFPVVKTDQSIAEVIASTPEFDRFHELLSQSTSLFSLLDEGGSWTVMVPTNAAFRELNQKARLGIAMSHIILDKFLNWHISDEWITPEHIKMSGIYTIWSYNHQFNLYIHCDSKNQIKMRNIPAVIGIQAKNGMIYAFDHMTIYPDILNELNLGKFPVKFESE